MTIVDTAEHTHECRDCGAEIPCCWTEDECQWAGGNDGCACAALAVPATPAPVLLPA